MSWETKGVSKIKMIPGFPNIVADVKDLREKSRLRSSKKTCFTQPWFSHSVFIMV